MLVLKNWHIVLVSNFEDTKSYMNICHTQLIVKFTRSKAIILQKYSLTIIRSIAHNITSQLRHGALAINRSRFNDNHIKFPRFGVCLQKYRYYRTNTLTMRLRCTTRCDVLQKKAPPPPQNPQPPGLCVCELRIHLQTPACKRKQTTTWWRDRLCRRIYDDTVPTLARGYFASRVIQGEIWSSFNWCMTQLHATHLATANGLCKKNTIRWSHVNV